VHRSIAFAEYKRKRNQLLVFAITTTPWALWLLTRDASPLTTMLALLASGFAALNIASFAYLILRRDEVLRACARWVREQDEKALPE